MLRGVVSEFGKNRTLTVTEANNGAVYGFFTFSKLRKPVGLFQEWFLRRLLYVLSLPMVKFSTWMLKNDRF